MQYSNLSFIALIGSALVCHAAQEEADVNLYFGCGCFWHVQHLFVTAEEQLLGRSNANYTALTGYAGGHGTNANGNVCYNDYGALGYAEVVDLRIPKDKLAAFASVYWKCFAGKNREDTMDRGSEYRAVIGLPGGIDSPLLSIIGDSQKGIVQQSFQLKAGMGGDPDTLGEAVVWVYDSDKYPFYQAELYHQFHDDFMPGGNYPATYNALNSALLHNGRMAATGCPGDGKSNGGSGGGSGFLQQQEPTRTADSPISEGSRSFHSHIALLLLLGAQSLLA